VHSVSGDCPLPVPQDYGRNIGGVIEKVATNVSNEGDKNSHHASSSNPSIGRDCCFSHAMVGCLISKSE